MDFSVTNGCCKARQALEVAPGVRWLRMPLPFQLNHINLWLIEEKDGWTIVDTGINSQDTRTLWEKIFAEKLGGKPVVRVIGTHLHPDHIGLAGWLSNQYKLEFDWTANQRNTLTAASIKQLGNMKEPVKVLAFATSGAESRAEDEKIYGVGVVEDRAVLPAERDVERAVLPDERHDGQNCREKDKRGDKRLLIRHVLFLHHRREPERERERESADENADNDRGDAEVCREERERACSHGTSSQGTA